MPEIGTSGLMSGEGKRCVAAWPKQPRLSSTLLTGMSWETTVAKARDSRSESQRASALCHSCHERRYAENPQLILTAVNHSSNGGLLLLREAEGTQAEVDRLCDQAIFYKSQNPRSHKTGKQ